MKLMKFVATAFEFIRGGVVVRRTSSAQACENVSLRRMDNFRIRGEGPALTAALAQARTEVVSNHEATAEKIDKLVQESSTVSVLIDEDDYKLLLGLCVQRSNLETTSGQALGGSGRKPQDAQAKLEAACAATPGVALLRCDVRSILHAGS